MIRYILYDPRVGGKVIATHHGDGIRIYLTPHTAKMAIKRLYYVSEDVRQHLKVGVLDLSSIKEYTDD